MWLGSLEPISEGTRRATTRLRDAQPTPALNHQVRCEPGLDEPRLDEAATEELRKLLRLRVPEHRTRACRFWQQGSCSRGDACGFAHANAADGTRSGAQE